MAIDLRKLLFMQQAQNEQNQNNLLSTNQAQSGLLGGLMSDPTARLLIGANLIGAGVKGSDPFSAITPAVFQTAQIKKALTPKDKRTPLMKNLEAAGFVPGTKEYQKAMLASTAKTETGAGSVNLVSKSNVDNAKIYDTFFEAMLDVNEGMKKEKSPKLKLPKLKKSDG